MEIMDIIVVVAAFAMLSTVPLILVRAVLIAKVQPEYQFGPFTIQLAAVGVVAPLILLLSMFDKLEGQTLGTLIGTLIGYSAASFRNKDRDQ